MRWSLKLSEYNFDIQYRRGTQHAAPDCISRYPVEENETDIEEFPLLFMDHVDLETSQKEDEWCNSIIKMLEKSSNKYVNKYNLIDDKLYKIYFNEENEKEFLLCVPKSLRKDILWSFHADVTAGHLSFLKTWINIRKRFYWPKLQKAVRKYVQNCTLCQARKGDHIHKGLLQSIPIGEPFDLVGMDIVGPLIYGTKRKQYIILVVDYATRYLEAKVLRDISSKSVSKFFVFDFVFRHGAVRKVLTDLGRQFISDFTENVFLKTKTKHIKTGYSPQTNTRIKGRIK